MDPSITLNRLWADPDMIKRCMDISPIPSYANTVTGKRKIDVRGVQAPSRNFSVFNPIKPLWNRLHRLNSKIVVGRNVDRAIVGPDNSGFQLGMRVEMNGTSGGIVDIRLSERISRKVIDSTGRGWRH